MSITDELREVAVKTECASGRCEKLYRGDLERIADRIDEAHKYAIGHINDQDPETMAKNGWIKLPVDVDGVPICVGDELDYLEALHPDAPARFKVQNMFYCGNGKWHLRAFPATYDPRKCRHHHEQAVEATLEARITGDTSDGYHTFNELYQHRAVLFSVIVRDHRELAWKSKLHHDGTMYDGMFIVGIETPNGQATYHYDIDPYWDMFDCRELERAPEWDGHTPSDAIERIATLGVEP